MPPKLLALIRLLDQVSLWSGRIVAWLIVPMVLGLVYEVVARYAFNAPTVWAYDLTYMLYGSLFMLGAAYTLQRAGHIRTDTFYAGWPPRWQGIADTIGYLVFFFPPLLVLFWLGADFFLTSLRRGERVVTSPWMPVIYPLKGVIPLACLLLLLQGTAELLRSLHAGLTGHWPPRTGAVR